MRRILSNAEFGWRLDGSVNKAERAEVAASLYEAWTSHVPIPPVSSRYHDMEIRDAYAVQTLFGSMLEDGGDTRVGYKLGLTSKPMQQMLGVDQPDYGHILNLMLVPDGGEIDTSRLIQPKIEAEIALMLDREIRGPGATRDDVRAAVAGASAALEVIDSRIENWEITLHDTIADLASVGRVVISRKVVPIEKFDIRLTGMTILKNGHVMDTGAGAAALGDPLTAVAWLANELAHHGEVLEAGRFVMTGSLHAAFNITAGDAVEARFDRLGRVGVRIR